MGIRASSTCELVFQDAKVSKEDVLGEIGTGYKIAIESLNEGRIGIGAQMVEYLVEFCLFTPYIMFLRLDLPKVQWILYFHIYTRGNRYFSHLSCLLDLTSFKFGSRIGDFQGVQFQYAQARVELEAARALVYNAARRNDAGISIRKEAAFAKYYR